jgi:hypothetical protein
MTHRDRTIVANLRRYYHALYGRDCTIADHQLLSIHDASDGSRIMLESLLGVHAMTNQKIINPTNTGDNQ